MNTNIPDIEVTIRDMSTNPRMLRREGNLPATIYGRGLNSVSILLNKKNFTYLHNTKNLMLVTLIKEGERLKALVKNIQIDPVSQEILNVEFLQVRDDVKVTLNIPLVLEKEAPATKTGSMVLQLMDEIEVECLPGDIPQHFTFDLSTIEEEEATITLADIQYPHGVKPAFPLDTPVIRLVVPKEETATGDLAEASAEPALSGS